MSVNHYKVLGLEPMATTSEIKSRYKKLAKQHHPDLKGDTKTMSLINKAYSVLGDPKQRFEFNKSIALNLDKPVIARYKPKSTPHATQSSKANFVSPKPPKARTFSLLGLILNPFGVFALLLIGLALYSIPSSYVPQTLSTSGSPSDKAQTIYNNAPPNPSSQAPTISPGNSVDGTNSNTSSPSQSPAATPPTTSQTCSSQIAIPSYQATVLERQIIQTQRQIARLSRPGRSIGFISDNGLESSQNNQYALLEQQLAQEESELSSYQSQSSSNNC